MRCVFCSSIWRLNIYVRLQSCQSALRNGVGYRREHIDAYRVSKSSHLWQKWTTNIKTYKRNKVLTFEWISLDRWSSAKCDMDEPPFRFSVMRQMRTICYLSSTLLSKLWYFFWQPLSLSRGSFCLQVLFPPAIRLIRAVLPNVKHQLRDGAITNFSSIKSQQKGDFILALAETWISVFTCNMTAV